MVLHPTASSYVAETKEAYAKVECKLGRIVSSEWVDLNSDELGGTRYIPTSVPCAVFIPNMGSFVSFKGHSLPKKDLSVNKHPPHVDWTFEFEKGDMTFFKTPALRQFDMEMFHLQDEINRAQSMVLQDLCQDIKKHSASILSSLDTLGQIGIYVNINKFNISFLNM
eukprot:GHVP01054020.1.p1 GENE.GHVP01054020.1~~GHVP01054020.1.p1  ORF type:complete len:167 (-),score=29.35 GHVP01054020.1:858-1358(-)